LVEKGDAASRFPQSRRLRLQNELTISDETLRLKIPAVAATAARSPEHLDNQHLPPHFASARQFGALICNGNGKHSLPIAFNPSEFTMRASVQTSASTAALALHSPQLGAVVAISRNHVSPNGGGMMVGGAWPAFIQRFLEKLASLKN
jgi:hypothetical protein